MPSCFASSMFREPAARGGVVESARRRSDYYAGLGGIAIAGIAGDQQAALFGQLCWSAAKPRTPMAQVVFCCKNIGTQFVRSKHRLITTLAASAQHRLEYALEGSIFIGGQWCSGCATISNSSALQLRLRHRPPVCPMQAE